MRGRIGITSSNLRFPFVTGGTVTADATYYYRTFTENGTLGVSLAPISVDIFAIGGGGGGGAGSYQQNYDGQWLSYGGNGGNAGSYVLTSGTSLTTGGSYDIVIGSGGAPGTGVYYGPNGGNPGYGGSATTITSLSISAAGGVFRQYGAGTGAGGAPSGTTGGPGISGFGTTYGVGGNGGGTYLNYYLYSIAGANAGPNGGGGGGGGVGNAVGGSGTRGIVVVRYLRSAVGG